VARVQEIGTAYALGFVALFTARLPLLALNLPVQPRIEVRTVFPHLFAPYFSRNFSSTDFTALASITGSRTFAPSRPPLLSLRRRLDQREATGPRRPSPQFDNGCAEA
jgi:hypothetical protein